MKTPDIPTLPGITKMTALDLNAIRIEKRHTILTPELLEKIRPQTNAASVQQG